MYRITVWTPPERAGMFAQLLRAENLEVTFDPPPERRSQGGGEVVQVVYWVANNAGAGLVGGTAYAAVTRAVDKVRQKIPKARIEVDPDESAQDPHFKPG
jgi:hypothetical protein